MLEAEPKPNDCAPTVAWIDYADKVQSLDPERPIEELAFEHIHFRDIVDTSKPGNLPVPNMFVYDYCKSISNVSGISNEEVGLELAEAILRHASNLLKEFSHDEYTVENINRRSLMWISVITECYAHSWANLEEMRHSWSSNIWRLKTAK